ncbi:hypothetical protein ACFRDV_14750 [Streptomyces fagopyri]
MYFFALEAEAEAEADADGVGVGELPVEVGEDRVEVSGIGQEIAPF